MSIHTPALVVALCALLAACAAPRPWSKAGASNADLRREAAQCRVIHAQASAAAQPTALGQMTVSDVYENCMVGKGWER